MTQYNAPRVEALSTIFKRLSHLTSNLARNLDFLPPSTSIKVCENKHGPQSPCYLFVTSDDADDLVTVQEYLALRNVGRLDCCRWNGYIWVNDNLTSLLPGNTMFVLHTYVWYNGLKCLWQCGTCVHWGKNESLTNTRHIIDRLLGFIWCPIKLQGL